MHRLVVTLAIALVTLTASSRAAAAPITTSQIFNFDLTDTAATAGAATATFQFDPFDATLGTLTQVKLSIGDPLTNEKVVLHSNGGLASASNIVLALDVLDIPLVASPFAIPTFGLNLCSSCGFSTDTEFTGQANLFVTYNASDANQAAPWLGNGQVAITLSDLISADTQNGTATAFWDGVIRLDYTYDAAPAATVPEPASLVLFGSGLGGAAWRRRQRRNPNRKS
jgi:hypothetical protein